MTCPVYLMSGDALLLLCRFLIIGRELINIELLSLTNEWGSEFQRTEKIGSSNPLMDHFSNLLTKRPGCFVRNIHPAL